MARTQGGTWKRWGEYLFIVVGVLFSLLVAVGILLYWDKIEYATGYGYFTAFIVSIFGGITIIPVPNLIVVFTLGHKLNPFYLGLITGLGEAMGGMTAYITGEEGSTLWSKFRHRQYASYAYPSLETITPDKSKVSTRWRAFYWRLFHSIRRRGAYWALFLSSAVFWWLYYPVALAAGSFKMGFEKFFLISWGGKTLKGLFIAFAGYLWFSALVDRIGSL